MRWVLGTCQIRGTVRGMVRPYDPRVCGGGYGITGRGPFVSAEEVRAGALTHGELLGSRLYGFKEDARIAIQTAPDYFVWWYTAKSIGLCVAVAALTFMLGRASAGCRR